jgi:hypothetical protein
VWLWPARLLDAIQAFAAPAAVCAIGVSDGRQGRGGSLLPGPGKINRCVITVSVGGGGFSIDVVP